jgi:hypothetical protein
MLVQDETLGCTIFLRDQVAPYVQAFDDELTGSGRDQRVL